MELGNQIKQHRKRLGISQAELAERIYVSSQTISNWENERSYPDIHNLIALSVMFDVSLDELVKGDVKEMKEIIDQENMNKYGIWMIVLIGLAMILLGPSLKYLGMYGLIIPFLLYAAGFYYSLKVEKLKKKYNAQTYKEILNYMETGKVNVKSRNQTKYMGEKILIVVAFGLIAGGIGFLSLLIFGI